MSELNVKIKTQRQVAASRKDTAINVRKRKIKSEESPVKKRKLKTEKNSNKRKMGSSQSHAEPPPVFVSNCCNEDLVSITRPHHNPSSSTIKQSFITQSHDDHGMWEVEWVLADLGKVSYNIAVNFVKLLREGNTLPFIARYRTHMVGNMKPNELVLLNDSYENVINLKKKATSAIENLKKSNQLTADITKAILAARHTAQLEMYDVPKTQVLSLAQKARDLGLEDSANKLLNRQYVDMEGLCDPRNNELATSDKVTDHIIHIIADKIYRNPKVVEFLLKLKLDTSFTISSTRTKSSTEVKDENKKHKSRSDPETYKLYFNFSCSSKNIQSHQVLAINRGENEKILAVKIIVPDWSYNQLEKFCLQHWPDSAFLRRAIKDSYTRLIRPWLVRQVRSELTREAHVTAIKMFSDNLERYLLTEPVKNKVIAGLDPGFSAGCKIGIIGSNGQVLDTCTIRPDLRTFRQNDIAASRLRNLIHMHSVDLIGLGNGTACRETETWLQKNGISDLTPVIIVPEYGASVYSISEEAREEFPNMEPNHISAVSIARRVLDPLGELIKVDPKSLGVGLYQHDVSQKKLESALSTTLEKLVSLVGVDLNTASPALLRRVAGLKENQVQNIIQYRTENGGFLSRQELLKVPSLGPKTFEQCAGFLRVTGGSEPLDATIVHPESYAVAKRFIKKLSLNIMKLNDSLFPRMAKLKINAISDMVSIAASFGTDAHTLEIITCALTKVSHETMDFKKPVYSEKVQTLDQLSVGMQIKGVVSNVVTFGCFVDCGVKDNGLVHTSKLGGNPMPRFGDRVLVSVLKCSEPKKFQLRLIQILD